MRTVPAVREAAATPRGVVVPAPPVPTRAAVPAGPRAHLAGTLVESPRVGTRYAAADRQLSALAPGVVVPAPQHAAGDVPQDQLALAAERTSTSPLLRGLGAPSQTWSVQGGALIIEGWPSGTVFAVRGADRSLAGWVEESADTGGWATFIDGRALVDSADGLPWLAQDERFAVTLLTTALRRRLA